MDQDTKKATVLEVRPLVDRKDPIIKEEIDKFDFLGEVDPIELAKELTEALLTHGGVGLSANQIGLRHRVFAIAANPVLVCYNPRIVDASKERILLEEGCLTFPGLSVKVRRSKSIKVRYQEPNGNVITRVFSGMTARIFQHELDHLNGLTMLDRCSIVQKEKAMRILKYGKK